MSRRGFGFGSALRNRAALGGGGVVQRNFTTLDPSLSMRYTIPTVILTGDFIFKSKFTLSAVNKVMAGTPNFNNFINFVPSDLEIRVGGNQASFGSTAGLDDGKLHDFEFTRVGSLTECFIDSISTGTDNTQTGDFELSFLGALSSGGSWDGILADVKITDAGTLIRNYAIDEDWTGPSTVLVDTGTDGSNGTAVNIDVDDSESFTLGQGAGVDGWIGQDVVVNGGFDTDANWAKSNATISGGAAHLDVGLGISRISQGTGFIGISLVEYVISSSNGLNDSGGLQIRDFTGAGDTTNPTTIGTHQVIKPFGTQAIRLQAATDWVGSIDNVSIKRFLEIA